jgi:hypothetical protein
MLLPMEDINMIHEIVIQAVDPAKRDEYIQEFGQTLKDAVLPARTESSFLPVLKTPAGSYSS